MLLLLNRARRRSRSPAWPRLTTSPPITSGTAQLIIYDANDRAYRRRLARMIQGDDVAGEWSREAPAQATCAGLP
jgi:hypothetical protein